VIRLICAEHGDMSRFTIDNATLSQAEIDWLLSISRHADGRQRGRAQAQRAFSSMTMALGAIAGSVCLMDVWLLVGTHVS
jgi:hypothetical protein